MENPYTVYYQKLVHKCMILLIVFGAITGGIFGLTKVNLFDRFLGKASIASRVLYISIGLAALSVAFNRDTYLPFLGDSVFPCSVLSEQTPSGASRSIDVYVQPGAKVVFWASEPGDGSGSWNTAYKDYQNAGVTTADSSGKAVLTVREPQGYTFPMKGYLQPHIHFRVCGPQGFVGRIKTVYLADGRVEGFHDTTI
jgi:uncharacterized membrane protein YuzA (DUF378 family)